MTGLAASTCGGLGVASLGERVRGGASQWPKGSEARRLPAPQVDIDRLLRATRTRHEPTVQLLAAVEQGLGPALAGLSERARARLAIALGNTSTALEPYLAMYTTGSKEGPRAVNPVEFPTTMLNYPATQLGRAFMLLGPNTTLSSGPQAGAEALEYAATRIALGQEPACLAGGLEVLAPGAGADEAQGEAPLTEGIGLLMLERESTPVAGPARAHLAGWASCPPASRGAPTSPAIQAALARADVSPSSVEVLVSDVTSAPEALDPLLTHRPESYALTPALGRCRAAAGPLAAVFAVDALARPRERGVALVVIGGEPGPVLAFVFTAP